MTQNKLGKGSKKVQQKWLRPNLIILDRGKTEENVLSSCKSSGISGPGRPAAQACRHPAQGNCLTVSPS